MNTQMNGNGRSDNQYKSTNTGSVNHPGNRNDARMNELFRDQLKDIYWAEKRLVTTLPNMHNASTTIELKKAFSAHLDQTKKQVERLEKVFKMIGEKAETKKCFAMDGIITESENIISETHNDTMQRDVGLIFASQKAEHYEIATYGGLVALAKKLGQDDVAALLHTSLTEEKEAGKLLTEIAEKNIKYKIYRQPVKA